MEDELDFRDLLERWYSGSDREAHARLYGALAASLYAPKETVDALGTAVVDEARQDVLEKLLDREGAALVGSRDPVAYARKAFRNLLATVLTKWGPRETRGPELRHHLELTAPPDPLAAVETRLDAERALALASELTPRQRLAVLLTTRPDRIAAEDWAALVANLPPPPPPWPDEPLERDEASLLLYPPTGPETDPRKQQRLNNFDHLHGRACAVLYRLLEEE